jgi:hypothetical protein
MGQAILGEPMSKLNGQRSRWVQTEAAKHTTPESIRQRIAHEEKLIQVLASAGLSEDAEDALKAHFELIKVLSERLARTRNTPP